jgi:hypothetical protein
VIVRRVVRGLRRRLDRGLEPVRTYRREVTHPRAGVPLVDRLSLLRDFVPWYRSQGASTLERARPWVTFEAARILERRLPRSARVFEYGSGGSTLFFARRGDRVVSVEHDRTWFEEVRSAVAGLPGVEVVLAEARPPRNHAETAFASATKAFAGQTFIDYVTVVDRFPDHSFDLLVVDGRARPSAFFRGEPKVRVGGLVLLDDSERSGYQPAVAAARASGWLERGGLGPKPFTPWFSRTTVWTKTRDLSESEPGPRPTSGTG